MTSQNDKAGKTHMTDKLVNTFERNDKTEKTGEW